MVIDNPVILVVVLVGLLIGIAVCFYVIIRFFRRLGQPSKGASRTGRTARDKPAEPSTAKPPAGRSVDPAAGSTPAEPTPRQARPAGGNPSGDTFEMFRVLRVGPLGELFVEIDGRMYRKITEIRDGTTGRRVLLAIQELDGFVGRHGRKPLPEMHRLSDTLPQPAAADPKESAFLGQLQEPAVAEEPAAEPGLGLVDFWRQGLARGQSQGATEPGAATKTFIDELEEMLQMRLVSHPEMEEHTIHFRSTPSGDLRIEVDGGLYEAVDDVPIPDVVVFLKATVRAWEQS